jgi:hypothetical protein
MGYVEGALAEPWACVTAAYTLRYRSALKAGGTAWIMGTSETLKSVTQGKATYTISAGFDAAQHPARLLLTNVPADFEAWLRARAKEMQIEVVAVEDFRQPPLKEVDDIVLLGADPDVVEAVSPCLAQGGVFALVADAPMPRKVNLDVGRIHYNRWTYVGGTSADVSQAYSQHLVRSEIKPGGRAWFAGAGGPMGRMHVQRSIQISPPAHMLYDPQGVVQQVRSLRPHSNGYLNPHWRRSSSMVCMMEIVWAWGITSHSNLPAATQSITARASYS